MALHELTLISGSYLSDYHLLDQIDDYITGTFGWAKEEITEDTGAEKSIVYTASGIDVGTYDEASFRITAGSDRITFYAGSDFSSGDGTLHNEISSSGIYVWPGGKFWLAGNASAVHLSVQTATGDVYHGGCGFWDTYYTPTYDPKPYYVFGQHDSAETFEGPRCFSYGPRSWGPTASGINGDYLEADSQAYRAAHNTDLNFAATQVRTGQPYLFDPVFYSLENFQTAEVRGEIPGLYMLGGTGHTQGDIISVSGTHTVSGTIFSDFLINKNSNASCWALGDIISVSTTSSPPYNYVALPLTYDENDYNGVMTWVRQGSGPVVTTSGLEGDSYQARLKSTTIPAWMSAASSAFAMQATVQINQEHPRATSQGNTVLHVGATTSGVAPNPKMALRTLEEPQYDIFTYLGLQVFTSSLQTLPLCRPEWKFRFRFPVLTKNGETVRPQAMIFLDADTIVVSGHYNDTESVAYKLDANTGEILGSFSFGGTYKHIASMARSQAGDVWCLDYLTETAIKVDLDASFASGTASITATWILTNLTGPSGIDFITVSGTNYVLIGEYDTSGTLYLYVIAVSQMVNGSTFNIANRFKRFPIGLRVQGIAVNNGSLYVSRNRNYLDATTTNLYGSLEIHTNIASKISSQVDGTSMIFAFNHKRTTPSRFPQDIKFHPTTNEVWTSTEGWDTEIDFNGWLSIWSSTATGLPTDNTVNTYYDGSGRVIVKLNNKAFDTMSWTPTTAVAAVSVGGPPFQTTSIRGGYFAGYIRNVRFQSTDISDDDYNYTAYGAYEPYDLAVYNLTITNPGAESSTTGWTNETGGISTRSANPSPLYGTAYFFGGANVETVARQRLDLLSLTGLTGTTVDSGNIWAKVRWWQTAFNGLPNANNDDTGSMGIRTLNSTPTQITLDYSGIEYAPFCVSANSEWFWYGRNHSLTVVSGTRFLDAVYRAVRTSGTNNDCYIDGISMTIYRRPY